MNIEELKKELEKLIASNQRKKDYNYRISKGLDGSIATMEGSHKDGFYEGKIKAYKYILELLNKEEK